MAQVWRATVFLLAQLARRDRQPIGMDHPHRQSSNLLWGKVSRMRNSKPLSIADVSAMIEQLQYDDTTLRGLSLEAYEWNGTLREIARDCRAAIRMLKRLVTDFPIK